MKVSAVLLVALAIASSAYGECSLVVDIITSFSMAARNPDDPILDSNLVQLPPSRL